MTEGNERRVATINDLITTCKDGANGFSAAAEAVTHPILKTLFQSYAQKRTLYSAELQEVVCRLGGDPEQTGSVAGSLHRGWINLKSVLLRHDDLAIVLECERGEEVAEKAYTEALATPLDR